MFLVEQANSVILKGSADFFSHMMNVLSVPVLAIEDSEKEPSKKSSTSKKEK